MKKQISKTISLLIILAIYLLAIFVGFIVHRVFHKQGMLISVFFGNIAATIVVWIFTVVFNNSSVYDPYWSSYAYCYCGILDAMQKQDLTINDALVSVSVLFWESG